MPNAIAKTLHLCFCNLKQQQSRRSESATIQDPVHHSSSSSAASSIVYKNFNSLYEPTFPSDSEIPPFSTSMSQSLTLTITTSSPSNSTADFDDLISSSSASDQDLISAIASRRLSLSSPGRSNSIVDSATVAIGDGLLVRTYSADPNAEFKKSMAEMATALGLVDARRHRDRLHELLLCYLALNGKHAHEYIFGAFAELLADLTPPELMGRRRRTP